jgi:polysaccharidase protein
MPNIYYVDSVNGSDSNSGLSQGGAFRSLSRIESVRLQPGDQVLFARGSVFNDQLDIRYSGTTENPIVFGAYGAGELPTFSGPNKGVSGSNTSNIVVRDIRIAHTGDVAFYGANANNWTIQNVVIADTSRTTGYGGISWKNSSGLTITNSTFNGVHGDGIFVNGVNGLNVVGSTFSGLEGANADGIQTVDSTNVSITGNSIDMESSPNSTKGGIVVNRGDTVLIADNDITGGSYGMAVTSRNVTIQDNNISGQTRYSWSAGILVSENSDAANYLIEGNVISDGNFGVAITSSSAINPPLRQNIEIAGNTFDHMSGAAVKVDRPTTGSYHDNAVMNTTNETYFGPAGAGAFVVETDGPNTYYVDSVNGSDSNSGRSAGSAFRSLDRIESISLQPGDRVLFARGSVFNDQLDVRNSGTAESPIVFGAYGTGDLPTFSGPNKGISGGNTSNIVVQDIRIANTGDAAFAGTGASNWTIQNVIIEGTGRTTGYGGISWRGGSNLIVRNSTLSDVNGDGIFADRVNGLNIAGNTFLGLVGANADGVQASDSTNVSISGNHFDVLGSTNSNKGGIAINRGSTILIENNDIIGGSFGASITSTDVTIRGNDISGQTRFSWSAGILIGANWDASNYLIEDNLFHDSNFGVAVTSSGDAVPLRENIEITGNTFDHMLNAGIKVDRPASGSAHDNTVLNSAQGIYLGGRFGYGTFTAESSTTAAAAAAVVGDGAESLLGTPDDDGLRGRDGNDTLNGGDGADQLVGGADNDLINGSVGNDQAFGDDGNDVMRGEAGNDILRGGVGSDSLDGGIGSDTLDGGSAFDLLFGGDGADMFYFARPSDGADLVRDFVSGTDTVGINGVGFGLGFTGQLPASMFESGSGLPTSFRATGPVFYLDTGERGLWFDPTGGSASDAQRITRFEGGVPSSSDIVIR